MEKTLLLYLLLISFITNAQQTQSTQEINCAENIAPNLLTGILAYYPFSNGSLSDLSGNGHDLINTFGVQGVADRIGNTSCAFAFDNTGTPGSQYLTTTDTAFLNSLGQVTVSLWYQIIGDENSGILRSMLNRGGPTTSCPDRTGQWSVGTYDGNRAVFARKNSAWQIGPPQDYAGIWQHAVATYNQTGETIKLYINGVLQQTKTGAAGCTPIAQVVDAGDLFIGWQFNGNIDDVFIYNRVLDDTEILQLYNLGTCCSESILLSTNEISKPDFSLYPNPAKNTLNISSKTNANINTIIIYNTLGQEVMKVMPASRDINVSKLPVGGYIVKVISDTESWSAQFIKD